MTTKNGVTLLLATKCTYAVKAIYELLPYADGIAALAFIVEAINAIDLATLMVASQEEEVLFKLDLVREEQDDALK